MKAITKCRNCRTKPAITSSEDRDYKFVLRHKVGATCYPSYKLESYQDTEQQCIDDWNEFNLSK
jgi:hypothetical protein